MHAIAVAAGAIVFPVALVVPWDPDSGGGIGPVIALTVAAAASITEGRLSTSWRGVAAGAEVGVLALAAYALGTYVAYWLVQTRRVVVGLGRPELLRLAGFADDRRVGLTSGPDWRFAWRTGTGKPSATLVMSTIGCSPNPALLQSRCKG